MGGHGQTLGKPEHFTTVNAWSGGKGKVTETDGTSHSLGIATSVDGSFSNLKAGGNTSLTMQVTSGTEVSQGVLVDQAVYNKVNYRDFPLQCEGLATDHAEVRPVSNFSFLDLHVAEGDTHTYYGSLYPAMTVVLARLVLHQRLLPLQLAGIVAALAGVVLVSVG